MIWFKLGMAVAALLFLLGLKHHYDEGIREDVRAREVEPLKAAWEKDKAERLRAYSTLMTEYVGATQEAERAKKERDDVIRKADQDRRARVAAIPRAVADVRVPLVAGVLNAQPTGDERGSGAAAGSAGQPAGGTTTAPAGADDTTVGMWADWSATMIDLYDSCRAQVVGLLDWYGGLRAKSLRGLQP